MKNEISEKNPEYMGNLIKQERHRKMYQVALTEPEGEIARKLIEAIGGKKPVERMLDDAFETLRAMFPHREDAHKQWTRRRLVSWWRRNSDSVGFRQMTELMMAAEKAKEERRLVEEARREHAEFIARTARIAEMLIRTDEAFHSPQIEGMGDNMGRVHSAGNKRY
jgi:hypothetical protein